MPTKVLSLDEYEKRMSISNKHKTRIFGNKFIFIIVIMCLFFTFSNRIRNSTHNIVEICTSNDVWIKYWFEYYNLQQYIDPITNKKLGVEKIQNLGIAVIKWESNYNSEQMAWESVVDGYSYGQYGLLSPTAKSMGWKGNNPKELLNPYINAKYSTKFLCLCISVYKGDIVAGLAAYNAGKCRLNKIGKIRNQDYIDNIYPIYVKLNLYSTKIKSIYN